MVSQRTVNPWLRHSWFESKSTHFTLPFRKKFITKEGIIIIQITKNEKNFLISNGVGFGENGIVIRKPRHRRVYYVVENAKIKKLLADYNKMILIK